MSGDLPCNAACGNAACAYNHCGLCRDNCPCEEREGDAPDPEDYNEEEEP